MELNWIKGPPAGVTQNCWVCGNPQGGAAAGGWGRNPLRGHLPDVLRGTRVFTPGDGTSSTWGPQAQMQTHCRVTEKPAAGGGGTLVKSSSPRPETKRCPSRSRCRVRAAQRTLPSGPPAATGRKDAAGRCGQQLPSQQPRPWHKIRTACKAHTQQPPRPQRAPVPPARSRFGGAPGLRPAAGAPREQQEGGPHLQVVPPSPSCPLLLAHQTAGWPTGHTKSEARAPPAGTAGAPAPTAWEAAAACGTMGGSPVGEGPQETCQRLKWSEPSLAFTPSLREF